MRSTFSQRRHRLSVGLVTTAAAALVAAMTAPAAYGESGAWSLGYDDGNIARPGQQITNTDTTELKFTGKYNGAPATVQCSIDPGSFSYDVPDPVPADVPGGSISLDIAPPTTIGGADDENGRCTESVSGNVVELTIPSGTQWTLTVNLPDATSPGPWTSGLGGSLHVPQGTVTVTSTFLPGAGNTPPCVISGPTDSGGLTVDGDYDPGTGAMTPTGNPSFGLDTSQCPQVATSPTLQDATVTLAGPNGATPTVVYQS